MMDNSYEKCLEQIKAIDKQTSGLKRTLRGLRFERQQLCEIRDMLKAQKITPPSDRQKLLTENKELRELLAITIRESQPSFVKLGVELGVSAPRAKEIYDKGLNLLREVESPSMVSPADFPLW